MPGSGTLYALVQSLHTGVFSSGVKCLFVEVLAGSVQRGEAVEVVRRDGSVRQLVARELRAGVGAQMVLDLEDPHPAKADVEGAAIVRARGLEAPSPAGRRRRAGNGAPARDGPRGPRARIPNRLGHARPAARHTEAGGAV
jgi:hypothetical protein